MFSAVPPVSLLSIILSLVNQQGVFATSFDTEGLDGIVFDPDHRLFKVGQSPFFVQIKCRGSNANGYNSRNFPNDGIRRDRSLRAEPWTT
jgi:hypothetical protein